MTHHSLARAKMRMGLNQKMAQKQIKRAIQRGRTFEQFVSWERKYLEMRSNGNCKAIAYNGYCYIVDCEECLTVYALPGWFGKKKHFEGKKKIKNYKTYIKMSGCYWEDINVYAF